MVVVGGGAAAFAATSGKGNGQRVATAAVASVTQTVESSGTIASARKSASAFSVSGTVNEVGVKVGDTVGKGQLLARLDASSLQTTVDSAAATLATAQQRLETDKTGQTSGSTGSGTSGSGTSGSSTSGTGTSSTGTRAATTSYTTGSSTGSVTATEVDAVTSTGGGTSVSGLVKQIVAAQNAVTGGQKKVDATQSTIDTAQKTVNLDIAQNTKFRDAQQTSCAADVQADGTTQPTSSSPVTSSAGPTPTPTASSTISPSTAPSDSPSTTPPSSSPPSTVSAECASAMANYQAFAGTLSSDTGVLSGRISAQDGYLATLQTAMKKLDSLVGQLQKAAAGSGSGSGTPTTGPGQTKSGSGSGQTSKSGSQKSGGQTQSGQTKSGQSQSGQNKSGQSGQNQSGTSQSKTGQGQSGGLSSGSSGGSTAAEPASAAQLAADQAAIDAATAQLGVAKQSLSAATLTSPIAGTVAAVGLTVGTASNGGTITIVGSGAQQADVTVPLGQIDQVKAGQSATLSVDGVTAKVHGTVQSVGVLSSTSGSSTTFPVTIALSSTSPALFDGSGADVVITTATARGVITVPNSAIHTIGSRQTVTVVDGTKTTTAPVTVGVSDSNRTQIKSGLKAGQQVVLAELSQPLPGSSTSANTGTGRFAGGFGGGGNLPNFGTGGRAGR